MKIMRTKTMKAKDECQRVLRTKEIAKKVIKDITCKKFWALAFVKTSERTM